MCSVSRAKLVCLCHRGRDMLKRVVGHMREAEAEISLPSAHSGPLLSAYARRHIFAWKGPTERFCNYIANSYNICGQGVASVAL